MFSKHKGLIRTFFCQYFHSLRFFPYYNARMKPDLTIESLNYSLRKNKVLNNINLHLQGAQAVCLLGPNGAGKSTLLKVCAAMLYAQNGYVEFNRVSPENNKIQYLSQIGYMPETAFIAPELTVSEQLKLMANIRQVADLSQAVNKVVELCQLKSALNKRCQHLSLGYRQRLNLAQAIINRPQLIIMDEPLNGLDPHSMVKFRNIINELKKSCLVLVSTHYLAEAQLISDRVIILQEGKILDNLDMNAEKTINLEQLYMQHTKDLEFAE